MSNIDLKHIIITVFIIQNKNKLVDILNYIKKRYNSYIKEDEIEEELIKLKKDNIIFNENNIYELTEKGNNKLKDLKYYYFIIIKKFLKNIKFLKFLQNIKVKVENNKVDKKYELKEVRKEQSKLREYLIKNKQHICVLCGKKLPLELLETAHLIPRCTLENDNELNDVNIVEFMCRYCHRLYDDGYLSVHNSLLYVSPYLDNFDDLIYVRQKRIICYNLNNEKYFNYHFNNVYSKFDISL
jgi:DNA-binding PadR family transcriptional regulator